MKGSDNGTICFRALGARLSAALEYKACSLIPDSICLIHKEQKSALTIIGHSQKNAIESSGLAPANPAESALLIDLAPGNYTAIVSGVGGATGVGLVEANHLP